MSRRFPALGLSIVVVMLCAAPLSAATVLHAGKLIDTKAGTVKTKQSIVIEGEHITRVADGYIEPQHGDPAFAQCAADARRSRDVLGTSEAVGEERSGSGPSRRP